MMTLSALLPHILIKNGTETVPGVVKPRMFMETVDACDPIKADSLGDGRERL
jgi:hypothetical protein